uniref:histone-lysine N-methyltransferase 2B-like n=1 Tax=Pristiophorus japonicus TaxID=55135 RepID=UPI00398F8D72
MSVGQTANKLLNVLHSLGDILDPCTSDVLRPALCPAEVQPLAGDRLPTAVSAGRPAALVGVRGAGKRKASGIERDHVRCGPTRSGAGRKSANPMEPNRLKSRATMLPAAGQKAVFAPGCGVHPNAVVPPSLDHIYAQWREQGEPPSAQQSNSPSAEGNRRPLSRTEPTGALCGERGRTRNSEARAMPDPDDGRQCALCLKYSDDKLNDAGRLLYIGQNEWTHVNCALWSAEVFEEADGSLKNVHMAVGRGKLMRCEHCQRPGATVGCCLSSCQSNYHFMCARACKCVFEEDKKVYCQRHKDLVQGKTVLDDGFEVMRRAYVDFEGITLRRKFLTGLEPENISMVIGSMTIDSLGILTELSECEGRIFPVGYQ